MVWVVFPLIMISLILLILVTLDGEFCVMDKDNGNGESSIKMVKW